MRPHRVPVILQMSATECGAACLAMILSAHGRESRITDCREALAAGRDGVTALDIASAARSQELEVKAYASGHADLRRVPLPAIVHWAGNHFVVLERWSPEAVEIVDPAVGRRRLTREAFEAGYSGVVMTFAPKAGFERRRAPPRAVWRGYLSDLGRQPGVRGLLVQILVASLLLQVLGLVLPFFTKIVVDSVLAPRLASAMTILGAGIALAVVAEMVVTYARATFLIVLQARVDSFMMLRFTEHLLALPYRFFQLRSRGDLLMRLASNATIRELVTSQTLSTLLDGSFVIVYLAILLVQAPLFGLLAAAIGLVQGVLLLATTRRLHALTQAELAAQADEQSYLVEALAGIATVKASGAEGAVFDRWRRRFATQLDISIRRSRLAALVETALTGLRVLAPLLLLWIGAQQVLAGRMTVGTMLALNVLAVYFLAPLASLIANAQQLQVVAAHLERLADVMEAPPEQEAQAVRPAPRLTGRIEVRNLSFRYDPGGPPALHSLSVTIEPGQKVAVVGPTGSGKSTFASLLLGLYPASEGEILYDGVPLRDLEQGSLRRQIGAVLQETFWFSGSIGENIAFNAPGLAMEEIARAARLAAIHDEIVRMPMRYETRIAEGGAGLSGGQRQRIALARALAQTPPILLLDEATSHLDAATERVVDEQLRGLTCTRIVIAHRLSSVRHADLILVLERGALVERGTHEELMARRGVYWALMRDQEIGDYLPA